MARTPVSPRLSAGKPRLHLASRWKLRTTLGVAALLIILGLVAVLSSRAATLNDTLLVITDVNGGFLNGIQAIDSKSGTSLGVADLGMPTLPGCASSQPKAYLGSMTVDQVHNLLYVSLKACPGGTLPGDKTIARIDLKTLRLLNMLPGPANARVVVSTQTDRIFAVRGDGMQIAAINAQTAGVIKSFDLTTPISRSGADLSGDMVTATTNGLIERFSTSGGRTTVAQSNVSFPLGLQAPDTSQLLVINGAWYALGKLGAQSVLAKISSTGTATSTIDSDPVSLTATKQLDHILIQTACSTGANCVASPNRMYSFNTVTSALEAAGQQNYFPLQQGGGQVRFNDAGTRLFFDGVVSGSSGVGQRFVFPLDTDGSLPSGARIAIPGSAWVLANLNDTAALTSQAPVTVAPSIPAGGGVGLSSGTVASTPVPLDEIERALGMSLKDINFDLITDAQIRAYGYDPAVVRKWVAQYKLDQAKSGTNVNQSGLCGGVVAGSGVDLAAIERQIGIPLSQIDFSKVTDAQIKQIGLDPKTVRDYVTNSKNGGGVGDSCANVFTQDGFTSSGTVDASTLAAGSAANTTAQTTFDLLKGGWIITLRWQAPGGAQKFRIYGRDNGKHKLEQLLATVGTYSRQTSFGGFSQLALPMVSDQTYWFSVVPELNGGQLGTPAAIKTRVRCLVWCSAEKVK